MTQAVVLIHGIGEQKPMDTLRKFVSGVLKASRPGREPYFSKPDRMSELFELRVLQSTGRSKTHFYEYYWAYHVKGTTLRHVISWFFDLMRRKRTDIPSALQNVWITFWTLTILLLLIGVFGAIATFQGWFESNPSLGFLTTVSAIILSSLEFFLIYYIGDAARYLDSSPENIAIRQKIRTEGLNLLRQLHNSGLYDRVIVVGHSLGSVIAYDLISRLWIEFHTSYKFAQKELALAERLKSGKSPQPYLRSRIFLAGEKLNCNSEEGLDEYRAMQVKGWNEQKYWGNKWSISDFVTIGSPLAHSMLLQANSCDDFQTRKLQRELPTCPPITDQKGYAYSPRKALTLRNGMKFCPLYFHHAAPFAITRWTNLYFPAFLGVFGDLVGGPLRNVYGAGIKDIRVKIDSLKRYTIFSHTSYWKNGSQPTMTSSNRDCTEAVPALKQALALDQIRRFRT